MKSIEYKFYHNGVAMSFWKGINETTIVFALGLPQYISSYHPFVETLLSMGYNLLVPKYYGTWESESEFTLANSVKSLNIALDVVYVGGTTELFAGMFVKIPNKEVILLGFSYGGFSSIFVDKKVSKKILLMPFVNIELHGEKNLETDLLFIQKAYNNIYKFNIKQFLNELHNVKYPEKLENLTVVVGQSDNSITKSEIDWFVEKYDPSVVLLNNLSHTANLSKEQFKLIL